MDIYAEILSALQTDDRVMLATIIATNGSTPAAALSKMLVKQGGIVSVGTVGGGCMEGDVLLHARRLDGTGKAEIVRFHLNEDDVEHGLICGGTLDVLIEPITRDHLPLVQAIQSTRDEGNDCVVATLLRKDGTVAGKHILTDARSVEQFTSHIKHPTSGIGVGVEKVFRRQETIRVAIPDGEIILEPVVGRPNLIIFGGGHVSKYVSRIASMAGFRVTIVDDREKFANKQRFPEANETIVADFRDVFSRLVVKEPSFLLIVTRGHSYDTAVLEQALKTQARYIGMIGSERKVLTAFGQLRERGIADDLLQRVHAPVGLGIGALAAEEIAVSIVAELIAVRRGAAGPFHHRAAEITNRLFNLAKC